MGIRRIRSVRKPLVRSSAHFSQPDAGPFHTRRVKLARALDSNPSHPARSGALLTHHPDRVCQEWRIGHFRKVGDRDVAS